MQEGKICFLHRLGQQGGYGVICDQNKNEYVFVLNDVVGYSGGPIEDLIYVGKEVSFERGNLLGTAKSVYLQAA